MKLQIIEYKIPSLLEGNILYRYILYIDGRTLAWTGSTPEKSSGEKVYDKLTQYLANNCKYLDINDYPMFNRIDDGLEQDVVFEKEVCDSYLKELYVKTRIQDIEEDFKDE